MGEITTRWWHCEGEEGAVRCNLCCHACLILLGKTGKCRVRQNTGGTLVSPYLGTFCSCAVDPIEKKPLYHWRPGTFIFSLGSIGCNMHCGYCQNHTISQPTILPAMQSLPYEELVGKVRTLGVPSVAYTYNEPTLQAEYIALAGPLLREAGIGTALVTNGMMSVAALEDLLPWIDAANVDIKSFNAATYTRLGGSLSHVQQTVQALLAAGKHVELTCLVVPGVSDSGDEFTAMVDWVASLSPGLPLHLSRYFPRHKYTAPATDLVLLRSFAEHAREKLKHVHLGNIY